jgi:hypothetical protein
LDEVERDIVGEPPKSRLLPICQSSKARNADYASM